MKKIIFAVDDDPDIREAFQDSLSLAGYQTHTFESAEAALEMLAETEPHIILLDLQLPGMDGLGLLERVKTTYPEIEVIIVTGHGDVSTSVKAMKLGARDYVKKPFKIDEILHIVQKTLAIHTREAQFEYLQKEHWQEFRDMVGNSPPMQAVYEFIGQVSKSSRTTVLIRGETGTGKELVARAIHQHGPRSGNPFVEVNCSSFQDNLLESELFGYEVGAFTGAVKRKKGLMELADKGTFFLDEIADMSIDLQAKLLKVIEERKFRRVGGIHEIEVDTRIISASSKNLDELMEKDLFRQDLYYRLNVVNVELPPLRDRGTDIIMLTEHFIQLYNAEFKHNITGIDSSAKKLLMDYSWPGNVRELRNTVERAVLFEKRSVLSVESLAFLDNQSRFVVEAAPKQVSDTGAELRSSDGLNLAEMECNFIRRALNKTNGNQTRAAEILGISREKLKYRLRKYGIG